MKVQYSKIVGIEMSEGDVLIKFRPAGSDESSRPETIRVTPHDAYLYLTFSFGYEDPRRLVVKPGMIGANHAQIDYVKEP